MSEDVAMEYSSLKRSSKSTGTALATTTNTRLNSLKAAKNRESKLQESLDSAKDSHIDELSKGYAEIAQLKEHLKLKDDTIAVLNDDAVRLRETIQVRMFIPSTLLSIEELLLSFLEDFHPTLICREAWSSQGMG